MPMASPKRIDINTATCEDLESLVGIGHAKAESIIEFRKAHGCFNNVNELVDIPGIGPSILEQNRGVLYCKSSGRTPRPQCERDTRRRNSRCEETPSTSRSGHQRVTRSEGHCDVGALITPGPSGLQASCLSTRSRSMGHQRSMVNRSLPETPLEITEFTKSHSAQTRNQSPGSSLRNGKERAVTNCKDVDNDENDDTYSPTFGNESENEGANSETDNQEANMVPEGGGAGDFCMDFSDAISENDAGSGGVLASLRSRQVTEKLKADQQHLMKRKCEVNIPSKDMSPGKKPCRLSESSTNGLEPDSPESPGNLICNNCGSSAFHPPSTGHPVSLLRRKLIPSKSNPPPELAMWLKTFQGWSHAERLLAVDELIESCEVTEVRHMMAVIEPQFQRDFISLLPKELALYVLSFLEPKDLCRAAQTCRYWRILASDKLLWREKCREEGITEESVYENQMRKRCTRSPWKSLYLRQKEIEHNWRSQPIRTPKVLKGHDDHVITCLEFCGTRIVSGSDDNTLKVWSAVTGKCLRTLLGHTGGVWSSQMSNNIIISGSTDRTLKVWNAETGQCLHTLYGHTSTVRCMCLHANKVVSGSRDATLRLWDVDSGECLHVLMGHVAAVRCVQYDGKRVVSGAYDYMVKVWDPETETCLHTLQGHTNRVYSLQFDGVHIVSGSLDTSIRVWDVESGQCLHTLIGHQSLTSGMELKDSILVSGNADSTVKVWDIKTGHCLQTLQGPNKHQSAVTCLQFNKKFVITSSDDGTVKIWSLKTGDFLRNLVTLESGGSGGVVWRIRCSNTKLVCAVGSRNGTEETKLLVQDFDVEDVLANNGNSPVEVSSGGSPMVRRSSVTNS